MLILILLLILLLLLMLLLLLLLLLLLRLCSTLSFQGGAKTGGFIASFGGGCG